MSSALATAIMMWKRDLQISVSLAFRLAQEGHDVAALEDHYRS